MVVHLLVNTDEQNNLGKITESWCLLKTASSGVKTNFLLARIEICGPPVEEAINSRNHKPWFPFIIILVITQGPEIWILTESGDKSIVLVGEIPNLSKDAVTAPALNVNQKALRVIAEIAAVQYITSKALTFKTSNPLSPGGEYSRKYIYPIPG